MAFTEKYNFWPSYVTQRKNVFYNVQLSWSTIWSKHVGSYLYDIFSEKSNQFRPFSHNNAKREKKQQTSYSTCWFCSCCSSYRAFSLSFTRHLIVWSLTMIFHGTGQEIKAIFIWKHVKETNLSCEPSLHSCDHLWAHKEQTCYRWWPARIRPLITSP